jgi:uncharacterized protein (TIGR00369 family)
MTSGSGRPFYDFLGLVVDPREDLSVVALPYRAELGNSREHVHGGAIAALLDAAMSRAVRLACPEASGVATISSTVHYLAPGTKDLTADGDVISAGGTIAVAHADVHTAEGILVAAATGTFRLFKTRISGNRQEDASAAVPQQAKALGKERQENG